MELTIIKIVDTIYEDIVPKTDLPHGATSLNGKKFRIIRNSLTPSFSRVFLLFGIIPVFKYTKTIKVKSIEYDYRIIPKSSQ